MKRVWRSVASGLLPGLMIWHFATSAAAQQPTSAQTNAIKQSCRSDYQANCAGVPTGGKAALQCLQQHLSVLSPPCQSAVSAVGSGGAAPSSGAPAAAAPPASRPPPAMTPRQEAALMRSSCGGDFRAYCAGVPMGGGRGLACLEANQSRLSPRCKGAMAEVGGR